MSSKVNYWKLDAPLSFGGKSAILDALRITSIDQMSLTGATITYEEAWTLREDPMNRDLVTSVIAPPGSGSRLVRISGATFDLYAGKLLGDIATEHPGLLSAMNWSKRPAVPPLA